MAVGLYKPVFQFLQIMAVNEVLARVPAGRAGFADIFQEVGQVGVAADQLPFADLNLCKKVGKDSL